jgi:hypothetical protein
MHILARLASLLVLILCACAPKGSIQGTLLAADGTPIADGRLSLHGNNTDKRGLSNAAPGFEFQELPADLYSLRVKSKTGWISIPPIGIRRDEQLDLGELTLEAFGSIQGTTPEQLKHTRLQVEVVASFANTGNSGRNAYYRRVFVVEEPGTFLVKDLRAGEYSIRLQHRTEEDPTWPSKLGIEAVVTVLSGAQAQVALAPKQDNVLVRGKVQKLGQPFGNQDVWFVSPHIEGLEESILRNIRTDSAGRFSVWIHPHQTPWIIARLGSTSAILTRALQIRRDGEEITWEVPTAHLTVNMVSTAGDPVTLVNRPELPAAVTWKAKGCEFHGSSFQLLDGSQAKLEHLDPSTEYGLFVVGADADGETWISIKGQTFTYPEQGESHTLDIVVEPFGKRH